MASRGDENAELEAASAGGTPASQVEPEVVNNSVYQPINGSQNHQKEKLQALGAVQIMNGATILALGVFLGSLQSIFRAFRPFFLVFYTGYPLWGAVFFIVSGSLSVAAGRKPTKKLVEHNFGMNIASTTIALVGFVMVSINLAVNKYSLKECPSSQSLDLCICMDVLSNGIMSLMLILTLLELCISISVSAMWCAENACNSREVTQILIALICLCFGIIVCSAINASEFKEDFFSSFKAGYPFWGAMFFAISGFFPILSEKKYAIYLVWGSLGANTVSSIVAGIGIFILTINLKSCWPHIYNCPEARGIDFCFVAWFSTEIVAMILFLTVLGFCSAVSLMIYGLGEVFQEKKIPEDRLYEELNIYSPIYSELEDKGETSSPADS